MLQIVCHTCYITGTVSGSYTPGAGINITGLEDDVMQSIDNFLEPVGDDLLDGNFSVFRTMDYSAVNLSNITRDFDYQLQFQLQDLELYMELETTLPSNSTYTLNLWTLPASALSLRAPKSDLSIGAFFTVDLILSSQTEINITSGVHIHIDSAAINVGMFDGNVSGVTL